MMLSAASKLTQSQRWQLRGWDRGHSGSLPKPDTRASLLCSCRSDTGEGAPAHLWRFLEGREYFILLSSLAPATKAVLLKGDHVSFHQTIVRNGCRHTR